MFDKVTPGHYSAKKIGEFAWGMYGLLILSNFAYYGDYYYQSYVMTPYQSNLAFRTIYGTANFIRVAVSLFGWLLAGFFWLATFTDHPSTYVFFSYIAMGLCIIEFARVLLVVIMEAIGLIVDKFDNEYGLHDYFQKTNGMGHVTNVGDKHIQLWLDYDLEMAAISVQFMAFPLFQYGTNNYWKPKALALEKKYKESIAPKKTVTTEQKAKTADKSDSAKKTAAKDKEASANNFHNDFGF